MSSFSLLVTHAPFDSPNAFAALRFAQAVLQQGHKLCGVFFYQGGIHNANSLVAPHSDEINLYDAWCQLAQQHSFPLHVCVTAANRRGVISQQDAHELDKSSFNLQAPFTAVGLGELMQLCAISDRVIQF